MLNRFIGASLRAVLVAILVMLPSQALQGVSADTMQIVVLVALLGAALTFAEYFCQYPSLIAFRNAPPINRLRFASLFLTVALLTGMSHSVTNATALGSLLATLGDRVGQWLDFPCSPIQLMLFFMPHDLAPPEIRRVRCYAGLALGVAVLTMASVALLVRILNWPSRSRPFNIWVNLPSFDPTAGGDVILRLRRDARVNVALGILLPFLIPVAMKMASHILDPVTFRDPQTLIWMVTAWAYLPANMMIRGIALHRISELIRKKRQRTYARAACGTV